MRILDVVALNAEVGAQHTRLVAVVKLHALEGGEDGRRRGWIDEKEDDEDGGDRRSEEYEDEDDVRVSDGGGLFVAGS